MLTVWATTQFEGFHRWPNAPTEVEFLTNRHRHMFHVRVEVEVFHDDRDVEFITLKRQVEDILQDELGPDYHEVGSCEMVAEGLADTLERVYDYQVVSVEVSEDLENGSTWRRD